MAIIDWNSVDKEKLTTRDGQTVRIYAIDGAGKFPIHGAVLRVLDDGKPFGWQSEEWTADGLYTNDPEGLTNLDFSAAMAGQEFHLEAA